MNVKTEFSGKMLTYLNVVSYMFCLMLGVKLNYNKLSLRRSRFLFPRHPRVMTDVFLSELGSTNTRQNHASSICSRYNLKKVNNCIKWSWCFDDENSCFTTYCSIPQKCATMFDICKWKRNCLCYVITQNLIIFKFLLSCCLMKFRIWRYHRSNSNYTLFNKSIIMWK